MGATCLVRKSERFLRGGESPQGLAVVLADVSGRSFGRAARFDLQGMVYSQLISGMPLVEIVDAVNRFFTYKHIGEKYATMIITRLRNDGDLEYVNCGHVPPVWICGNEVLRPSHGNLPVGLIAEATTRRSLPDEGGRSADPGD